MRSILIHYKAFGTDEMFSFHPGFGPYVKHDDVLDFVWRECNHVDGAEWIANKRLRSMCVGDTIILIDGDSVARYRVASVGFERIENRR